MKDTLPGTSRNPNRKLQEDVTCAINRCKWRSAMKWCEQRKLKFRVVTERELFSQ